MDDSLRRKIEKVLNKKLQSKIFINRQPSLWRHSIPFVDIVPLEDMSDQTIHISPLFLEPLNMDFDGDTASLDLIHGIEALEEAEKNAYLLNVVKYDHSETFLSVIRHESLYSLYLLTKNYNNIDTKNILKIKKLKNLPENYDLYNKTDTCVEFENNYYSYGICLFNKWCGFDKIVINETINKKNNNFVSQKIYEYFNNNNELFYENLTNLSKNLFFYISVSDYFCPTINIDEMINILDIDIEKLIQKIPDNILIGYLLNDALIEMCIDKFSNNENTTLFNLYKSGSRFSLKQLSKSCINAGFNADSRNFIQPKAIKTNLLKGLTEEEFFAGCSGTRKGLSDKEKVTPDSGYLERSLAMGLSAVEIIEEDCGTFEGLEIFVLNHKHKKTLINKWFKRSISEDWQLIISENDINVGDRIILRSPMLCQTKNFRICKKCWGEKVVPTKYVGILSSQIFSERFTQLSMRSFHDSGAANLIINKDLKDFIKKHIVDINVINNEIELTFNSEDIPDEFKEYKSFIKKENNKIYFNNDKSKVLNNDSVEILSRIKKALRVASKNILHPSEYYKIIMENILEVSEPYSSFIEVILSNMFIVDKRNNRLWRYYPHETIKLKLGDKTLSTRTSKLLGLLYQQNQSTIRSIESLEKYTSDEYDDSLTIHEKLFLEKF